MWQRMQGRIGTSGCGSSAVWATGMSSFVLGEPAHPGLAF